MRTFQDNQKRTWEVEINVSVVKRVRGALDLDLLGVMEGGVLERLVNDPVLLCDLIYVVCQPQAEKADISDEDFGRAMAGDAIDHATSAVLEELADFFPSPRRGLLKKSLAKIEKLEGMAVSAAEKMLKSSKLDNRLRKELKGLENEFSSAPKKPGGSSISSPAK